MTPAPSERDWAAAFSLRIECLCQPYQPPCERHRAAAHAIATARGEQRAEDARIALEHGYIHAGTMKRSHTRLQAHRVTREIAAAIRAGAAQ